MGGLLLRVVGLTGPERQGRRQLACVSGFIYEARRESRCAHVLFSNH